MTGNGVVIRTAATGDRGYEAPAEEEGYESFALTVANLLFPLAASVDDVTQFTGSMQAKGLGNIRLCNIVIPGPFTVRRTEKLIDSADDDCLKVGLQLRGVSRISQAGREATLAPGDYTLFDTSRPYRLISRGGFHMRAFLIPRNTICLTSSQLDLIMGRRVSRESPLGSLVSPFLIRLGGTVTPTTSAMYLADAAVDMLSASFVEQLTTDATAIGAQVGKSALLLQVHSFIEQQLHDPDLDVPTVASANHISVRYLQKLFEEQGQTVTGWIRSRRMERCRKDLANPSLSQVPITTIAARWGLVDAAYFSRSFRSIHGIPPSQYRRQVFSQKS